MGRAVPGTMMAVTEGITEGIAVGRTGGGRPADAAPGRAR